MLAAQLNEFACLGLNFTQMVGIGRAYAHKLQGAVTIAIRYSAQRQQFGPSDGAEIAVLDYQTQQRKLLPMLATAYALHFAKCDSSLPFTASV